MPIEKRLRSATLPAMVQVAPGRYVPQDEKKGAPDVTLAAYVENDDGTYRPVPFNERMVRVDRRLIHMLGFTGQWHTVRRLARAGFIEMIAISPRVTLLNLDSWFNHLRRCAEEPEFWEADANLEEYRRAL